MGVPTSAAPRKKNRQANVRRQSHRRWSTDLHIRVKVSGCAIVAIGAVPTHAPSPVMSAARKAHCPSSTAQCRHHFTERSERCFSEWGGRRRVRAGGVQPVAHHDHKIVAIMRVSYTPQRSNTRAFCKASTRSHFVPHRDSDRLGGRVTRNPCVLCAGPEPSIDGWLAGVTCALSDLSLRAWPATIKRGRRRQDGRQE